MFAKFKKTIKSLVASENEKPIATHNKRQRDDSDDDLIETYPKRCKLTDENPGTEDRGWGVGRLVERIARSRKTLGESFNFGNIVRQASPSNLLASYRERNNKTSINSQGSVTQTSGSVAGVDGARTWGLHNTIHQQAFTTPGLAARPSPAPPAAKTGYVDLPYPFVFPADVIWTQEGQFKVPTSKPQPTPTPSMDPRNLRPPLYRRATTTSANTSQMNSSAMNASQMNASRMPYNSTHRLPSYQPVYDKMFRHHSQQVGHSQPAMSVRNARSRLAARESVRLEEKNLYSELLNQFITSPDPGSAASSTPLPRVHKSAAPDKKISLLGSQIAPPAQSVQDVVTPEPGPAVVVTAHVRSKSQSEPEADLTPRSYLSLQHHYRNRRLQRPVSETESLGATAAEPQSAKETPNTGRSMASKEVIDDDEVIVLDSPSSSPAAQAGGQLERSLKDCRFDEKWFSDLTERFSDSARSRKTEIRQEKVKLIAENGKREEWENQLEERIRHRLRLSNRKPYVESYDYESSSESEEELSEEEDEFVELADEQEAMVDHSLRSHPSGELLSEGFRLQIRRSDMATLSGLNWLNDEIVNFYFELIRERGKLDNYPSVHVFNTFFYPKVKNQGHQGVRRWTKSVDIFSFKYIAIPIHLGMHWCLAVIDFEKKAIRYFDSMGGKNMECLNILKKYMADEHQQKKSCPFDDSGWELENVTGIPHQMNGSDCGVFTCKFADYVTRNKTITFTQAHMPYFRRRMVYEIVSKQLL